MKRGERFMISGYTPVTLTRLIEIEALFSVHYFEYTKDFVFAGEIHDFWEFLCVDKGEVEVIAGEEKHILHKGDIIFHQPNEFHALKAIGKTAPNLAVISFACHSPAMDFFRGKILTAVESDRELIAQIITEARNTFSTPLNDPYLTHMLFKNPPVPGSEQLIWLFLEELLVHMLRRYQTAETALCEHPNKTEKNTQMYNNILLYLEQHLNERLTVDKICRDNLIGRSHLQKIFRNRHSCGVIDYFIFMKIDAAKQMIRERQMNYTQISDALGYTSIHYFSRQFKQVTGMTPSEYASSIKRMTEMPYPRAAAKPQDPS